MSPLAPENGAFVTRLRALKLKLAFVVFGAAVIVIALSEVFMIDSPTGAPLGLSCAFASDCLLFH